MLNAKLIIFSRSLTEDYRWIYSYESLSKSDESNLMSHYEMFEEKKEFYLSNPHLIIRKVGGNIAIYSFYETEHTDQNSRKIYALAGCIFSDIDCEFFMKLYMYIVPYIFSQEDFFKKYFSGITDSTNREKRSIEIDLNLIVDIQKNKKVQELFMNAISTIWDTHLKDGFVITNNAIYSYQLATLSSFPSINNSIFVQRDNDIGCNNSCNIEQIDLKGEMLNNDQETDVEAPNSNIQEVHIQDINSISIKLPNVNEKKVIMEKKNGELILHF